MEDQKSLNPKKKKMKAVLASNLGSEKNTLKYEEFL